MKVNMKVIMRIINDDGHNYDDEDGNNDRDDYNILIHLVINIANHCLDVLHHLVEVLLLQIDNCENKDDVDDGDHDDGDDDYDDDEDDDDDGDGDDDDDDDLVEILVRLNLLTITVFIVDRLCKPEDAA